MDKENELYILWTNGDPITSEKMVIMYGHNAKLRGWWKEVTIIIWGAPAKLVAHDKGMRKQIKSMLKDGVKVSACRACSDQLGVTESLEELGIEVIYWGDPLTYLLKENKKLITI